MTLRQPPALATWLLNRFVSGYRCESLSGDLLEEYQTGRTRGWFWREVMAALLLAARYEIRRLVARHGAQLALLIAPTALTVWLVLLSWRYPGRCPAPPLLRSVGITEFVIALVLWLAFLGSVRRTRVVRLAVAAFATIGLSGGALTWASTSSCRVGPLACAPYSVTTERPYGSPRFHARLTESSECPLP
jgi:hypothetical protein